ncbi:MAG TPA: class I adenylate-forming enzyme family protein [Saprospiraceae bacterium]|nr:class I adenylate-forming enzyme family protein [Saprospiraceae bacterium]HPN70699.1 class I adenylate-forming enzyme family protein [Saprospiraceae bacterium]
MHTFYTSIDAEIDYEELLDRVNQRSFFYQSYLAQDYLDFITNLICGLIHQHDVTLIDYTGITQFENSEPIELKTSITDVASLINQIVHSVASVGIYSSGSEGPPKLVFQTIKRLMQSVRIEAKYQTSTWGFTYNPTHSAGIQMFLQVIANQSCLVDLHKISRQTIITLIHSKSLKYLSATPTFYRMLAPYDFEAPSVKSVTLNGEKSTLPLILNVKKVFPNARIRNIYGSTEVGPLMSSETDVFQIPERLFDKVKIEDGELIFHESIVSKSVLSQEWYPSGDLVEVISDKPLLIKFVSRKSRILNVAGHNVNPQNVEEVILELPGVVDARVTGKENALIGNLLVAEVQVIPDYNISEKTLMNQLKTLLPAYKVPRIITFVNSTQIGRTGKKLI